MAETPTDQAPVQSVEDRIASAFGIQDDQPEDPEKYDGRREEVAEAEETAEEPAAPEPEEVEIEYDGETFRIPRKLEKGILQEKDYTQKTQALAEQRRQVEFAQKALEASRFEREFTESVATEQQQMQMLDAYLQQLKSVNVSDLPMEDGFRHWMQLQQVKEQRESLEKSITSKRAEYERKVQEHVKGLRVQARELLAKQIGDLNDETLAALSNHAKSLGYTDTDWDLIQADPRAATLLYKAMKYDQLQANKAQAVTKATTPVVKPGSSNPMPQAVKDKLAFNKAMKSAKTSQEKARLIEQRLMGSFR